MRFNIISERRLCHKHAAEKAPSIHGFFQLRIILVFGVLLVVWVVWVICAVLCFLCFVLFVLFDVC